MHVKLGNKRRAATTNRLPSLQHTHTYQLNGKYGIRDTRKGEEDEDEYNNNKINMGHGEILDKKKGKPIKMERTSLIS